MKPRINANSVKYITRIDQYIQQYDLRGADLLSAASDELDGAVYREEIEDLVRRKLLTVIRYEDDQMFGNDNLSGFTWSVSLTERAIHIFWPNRV
jgi:hypothetical protein